MPVVREITACRSCAAPAPKIFLRLGETPLADRLLEADELSAPELRVPLDVARCDACSLVQLMQSVSPRVLFDSRYPYFSSTSSSWLAHCQRNALELIERLELGAHSRVVEIASNDGYLLRNFRDRGIPVLGIEPAAAPAARAREVGIPVREAFFDRELAGVLVDEGHRADLVIANNVLAHVEDLNGFVSGIGQLLNDGGMAVFEVPYVADLIANDEYDTIYHQHRCYFSVSALQRLLSNNGLYLNTVRHLEPHGGSLRLYVGKSPSADGSVRRFLDTEQALDEPCLRRFAARVDDHAARLGQRLRQWKDDGMRLVAYGAAAKGTTLMSRCGIDGGLIDYVVDANPFKQGRYLGGNHLPIVSPERLLADRPDGVLLLAWNLAEEILAAQQAYRRGGGRFLIPLPTLREV